MTTLRDILENNVQTYLEKQNDNKKKYLKKYINENKEQIKNYIENLLKEMCISASNKGKNELTIYFGYTTFYTQILQNIIPNYDLKEEDIKYKINLDKIIKSWCLKNNLHIYEPKHSESYVISWNDEDYSY